MSVVDQVLMRLMKLKLNLVLDNLVHRFKVSQGVISNVIAFWIDVMAETSEMLDPLLPGETIQAKLSTMSRNFKRDIPMRDKNV
jgi:hypothetical protein